jgi:magnesium chelatase family protein
MLARRLPSILPPLSFDEALEATKLYSIAGLLPAGQVLPARRPFRAPHHSISDAGLVGGGSVPPLRRGEPGRARSQAGGACGVLFLDYLVRQSRRAREVA